jgi:hypothetical protein
VRNQQFEVLNKNLWGEQFTVDMSFNQGEKLHLEFTLICFDFYTKISTKIQAIDNYTIISILLQMIVRSWVY